jgi:DNA-binding transcriptional LysR family regulator
MSNLDHLNLDGRLLQLLLIVIEERSVTKAAYRLGITQSAVSHMLDKLRGIVDDPLFVKSGRGIMPTVRAEALALQARVLLEDMRLFASAREFDPSRLQTTLTIAANDLQRDLLLPRLLSTLRAKAPGITLRVMPSGIPSAEMLRDEHCHLVISPRPPSGSDILQKRLFADSYQVFYDGSVRPPPLTLQDYLDAEHVTVAYEAPRLLGIDQVLTARGIDRKIVAMVPGFAGIRPFLLGSKLLATLPSLLRIDLMTGLDSCTVPIDCPEMPMYMIWHLRHRNDPLHSWLRDELDSVVAVALREAVSGRAGNAP